MQNLKDIRTMDRRIFKTLPNLGGAFCGNNELQKTVNYFQQKLHRRR